MSGHANARVAVCILAGGLSARMGRDKGRLRIGRRTLVGHIRATAAQRGLNVRVIRRDLVPRCGPLGGVLTALRTTQAPAVLFLACDMPLVSAGLMERVLRASAGGRRPVFAWDGGRVGFPFVVPRAMAGLVATQVARRRLSLLNLAKVLEARMVRVRGAQVRELMNINTPGEWMTCRGELARKGRG